MNDSTKRPGIAKEASGHFFGNGRQNKQLPRKYKALRPQLGKQKKSQYHPSHQKQGDPESCGTSTICFPGRSSHSQRKTPAAPSASIWKSFPAFVGLKAKRKNQSEFAQPDLLRIIFLFRRQSARTWDKSGLPQARLYVPDLPLMRRAQHSEGPQLSLRLRLSCPSRPGWRPGNPQTIRMLERLGKI